MSAPLTRALNEANELHLTDGTELLCGNESLVPWWTIEGEASRPADLTCTQCQTLLRRILAERVHNALRRKLRRA